MTGNCTQECTEFGHSDACWMPGQPSPLRKTRNPPKLTTFLPYQERGGVDRLAPGGSRLPEERCAKVASVRLLPSHSAYSCSSHEPGQAPTIEETSKKEIYLCFSIPSGFTPPVSRRAPFGEVPLSVGRRRRQVGVLPSFRVARSASPRIGDPRGSGVTTTVPSLRL
ncbi:protocadherin-1-like [Arapaima gigas]